MPCHAALPSPSALHAPHRTDARNRSPGLHFARALRFGAQGAFPLLLLRPERIETGPKTAPAGVATMNRGERCT